MENAAHVVPEDALCFECGYPLRGLISHRCPECGWKFDPTNRELMDLCRGSAKYARHSMGRLPALIRDAVVLSSFAIIWGSAWLPGGMYVAMPGWFALLLTTCYSLYRRFI